MTVNMPDLPGYEVLEKIGEGGMAVVWKARQVALDRLVAIKVLSAHMAREAQAVERFRQEARAAARLSHPCLVQVHDAGEHAGLLYYVMEYIAGPTVGALLLAEKRLKEARVLGLAEGITAALQYAWDHEKLIHCDIKPENIMVDERAGYIKVADLGLARVLGKKYREDEEDYILGTLNYVSPEQAAGQSDLDCRTDIYALGATLYHLLTGKLPFAGRSATGVLEGQIRGTLPDLREIVPSVSAATAWLLEKMMVKDRAQRYASWDEVIEDLECIRKHGTLRHPVPQAGLSTLRRSLQRPALLPAPRRPIKVKLATAAATAGPQRRRQRRFSMGSFMVWLLALGAIAWLSHWAYREYRQTAPAAPRGRATAPRTAVPPPAPRPPPPPQAPRHALDEQQWARVHHSYQRARATYDLFRAEGVELSLLTRAQGMISSVIEQLEAHCAALPDDAESRRLLAESRRLAEAFERMMTGQEFGALESAPEIGP